MERGRSLCLFNVKGQISRSLGFYKDFWHLDPCGQVKARTMLSSCSNLVCALHMERGRSLFIFKFKGQISRSLGLYKEFRHLDPCGQDIARNMQYRLLKLSMYTSYRKRKKPFYFQGQRSISRSLGLYKDFWHLAPCGQDIARTMQSLC